MRSPIPPEPTPQQEIALQQYLAALSPVQRDILDAVCDSYRITPWQLAAPPTGKPDISPPSRRAEIIEPRALIITLAREYGLSWHNAAQTPPRIDGGTWNHATAIHAGKWLGDHLDGDIHKLSEIEAIRQRLDRKFYPAATAAIAPSHA